MRRVLISLLAIVTLFFLLPANLWAQCDILHTITGQDDFDFLGISVASAGDVNNDGYDDVIIGANGSDYGCVDCGAAYVFSGQTGDTLYVFTGEAANDEFGYCVASAGDVNNDGYDDVIIGAYRNQAMGPIAGRAYVFSGQTGDTLYVFTAEADSDYFGYWVASAGDVNNDNFDDIIIGAYLNDATGNNAGRAYVFSGQTGDTLYVFSGESESDGFGVCVAGGDVNNDGFSDLIIGAYLYDNIGFGDGRVYVFSGQDGDTLYVFTGEGGSDNFGASVSSGDVDSDNFDDIVIGARYNSGGGGAAGRAYVFSGQTGDTLYIFTGYASNLWFGYSVSSGGDIDNDGYDDILIGVPLASDSGANTGRTYTISGQTGDTICILTGESAGDVFGGTVCIAGDVNNDGFDDIIVAAQSNDVGGNGAGRAYVFGTPAGCCIGIRGDLNNDGADANILDLNFAVNRVFRGGPLPVCPEEGDCNSDGSSTNILDLNFLVNRVFRGGPLPGPCD